MTDFQLKVIGAFAALVAGAAAVWRLYVDLSKGRKDQLREQYDFAKKFLSDQSTGQHAFVRSIGLQALVGDSTVDSSIVHRLLEFPNPQTAVRLYEKGRPHVRYEEHLKPSQFLLKGVASHKLFRQTLVWAFFLLYFLAFIAGFLPLFLVLFRLLVPSQGLTLFLLAAMLFFPVAFWALRSGAALTSAARLIKIQRDWLGLRAGAE